MRSRTAPPPQLDQGTDCRAAALHELCRNPRCSRMSICFKKPLAVKRYAETNHMDRCKFPSVHSSSLPTTMPKGQLPLTPHINPGSRARELPALQPERLNRNGLSETARFGAPSLFEPPLTPLTSRNVGLGSWQVVLIRARIFLLNIKGKHC